MRWRSSFSTRCSGGEPKVPGGTEFVDIDKVDVVGLYPNYKTAYGAWRGVAMATVDDAHTRYFIVHLHRLLDPEEVGEHEDHEPSDHEHDHD